MGQSAGSGSQRRYPRFKLDTDVKIRSPKAGFVPGQSLEISERGLSAILPVELPLGESVHLEFKLPLGEVAIQAVVRNRSIYRHGFEFASSHDAHEKIRQSCGLLPRAD
ncbi:MAG: PilZ domain-containing protein [Acidobacteria bacterium]|jgi:hypothetical protein|nr:PilZ domain-containing protein [Acidobacteriota bacterium]